MNTYEEYDGIVNKPGIDELIIQHYGVKGMKWRHRKLRNNLSLLGTKARRQLRGMSADQISYGKGKSTFERHDDGKARSTSNPQGNRRYNGKLEIDNRGYSSKSQEENGRLRNGYPDDRTNHNYAKGSDGILRYIKKLRKR